MHALAFSSSIHRCNFADNAPHIRLRRVSFMNAGRQGRRKHRNTYRLARYMFFYQLRNAEISNCYQCSNSQNNSYGLDFSFHSFFIFCTWYIYTHMVMSYCIIVTQSYPRLLCGHITFCHYFAYPVTITFELPRHGNDLRYSL